MSRSASSKAMRASLIAADETWAARPAWSRMAATTAGWLWPIVVAAKLAPRSTNRLPSGSVEDRAVRLVDDERVVRAGGPRAGALDRAHPLDDGSGARARVGRDDARRGRGGVAALGGGHGWSS